MWWPYVFALVVVVLVYRAVASRRSAVPRTDFPWFWVVFPLAAMSIAGSLAVWLPWSTPADGWSVGLGSSATERSMQFLGNEQFREQQALLVRRWLLPLAAVASTVLSIWAWTRRRV